MSLWPARPLIAEVVAGRIGEPGDAQVLRRDLELVDEPILEDVDLAEFELPPQASAVVADVTDFKSHVLGQLALDTEGPGLDITRPEDRSKSLMDAA